MPFFAKAMNKVNEEENSDWRQEIMSSDYRNFSSEIEEFELYQQEHAKIAMNYLRRHLNCCGYSLNHKEILELNHLVPLQFWDSDNEVVRYSVRL